MCVWRELYWWAASMNKVSLSLLKDAIFPSILSSLLFNHPCAGVMKAERCILSLLGSASASARHSDINVTNIQITLFKIQPNASMGWERAGESEREIDGLTGGWVFTQRGRERDPLCLLYMHNDGDDEAWGAVDCSSLCPSLWQFSHLHHPVYWRIKP